MCTENNFEYLFIFFQDYELESEQKKKQEPKIQSGLLGNLKKYAIQGSEESWQSAVQDDKTGTISVKRWVECRVVEYFRKHIMQEQDSHLMGNGTGKWIYIHPKPNITTVLMVCHSSNKRPAVMTEKELEAELTRPAQKKQKKGKGRFGKKR